ncbi:MAG: HU family DNA-binding protein [bacterium]|nr:HU family DNA-binding protein [bacterium]
MTKAELMERIAERARVSKKQAEDVMEAFENIVYEQLKAGEEVTLTGFGTFIAKERHARMGVNPQNPTERIQIPKVTVPKFKSGKAFKDALKEGKTPSPAETPLPETPSQPESAE